MAEGVWIWEGMSKAEAEDEKSGQIRKHIYGLVTETNKTTLKSDSKSG